MYGSGAGIGMIEVIMQHLMEVIQQGLRMVRAAFYVGVVGATTTAATVVQPLGSAILLI